MLCSICASMFSGSRSGSHHETIENVKSASNNGCLVCSRLLFEFRRGSRHERRRPSRPIILKYRFTFDGVLITSSDEVFLFNFELKPLPNRYAGDTYQKYIEKVKRDMFDDPCRVRDNGLTGPPAAMSNTGDVDVLNHAKQLFQQCLDGHNDCRKISSSLFDETGSKQPWQPKRLIDYSASDGNLRVIRKDTTEASECFATLSYCWGKAAFFTLTAQNEEEVLNGAISLSKLPRVFVEAITVCRELGIRYLWIDSICIIQSGDGGEDWELHAREMSRIYSSCILSIAVEHAKHPGESLFTDRHPAIFRPTPVAAASRETAEILMNRRRSYAGYHPDINWGNIEAQDTSNFICEIEFSRPEHYSVETSFTTLSSRGWVMQERLLSPRILHFTKQRIVWSCNASCFVEGSEKSESSDGRFNLDLRSQFDDPTLEEFYVWRWWHERVDEYSRRQFSYPDKDKLVAMAGIVQAFNKRGEEYLAGLFRSNLPWALLWEKRDVDESPATPSQETGTAASPDRAPSWSWASLHAPIQSKPFDVAEPSIAHSLVDLGNVDITLSDPNNPYGGVKKGTITLQGVLGLEGHFNTRNYHRYLDGRHDGSREIWHLPVVLLDGANFVRQPTQGLLLQTEDPARGYHRVGTFESGEREITYGVLRGRFRTQSLKLI